ncbi:uncharacterized protein BJX67DRAFT_211609 [Aspergillus lucknowensis]|uniref:Uncharacterized protein n=1 Tax=Aspergillus lucknowensis TaxID=176173 RepID=A0ABR4M2B7_9EURO
MIREAAVQRIRTMHATSRDHGSALPRTKSVADPPSHWVLTLAVLKNVPFDPIIIENSEPVRISSGTRYRFHEPRVFFPFIRLSSVPLGWFHFFSLICFHRGAVVTRANDCHPHEFHALLTRNYYPGNLIGYEALTAHGAGSLSRTKYESQTKDVHFGACAKGLGMVRDKPSFPPSFWSGLGGLLL